MSNACDESKSLAKGDALSDGDVTNNECPHRLRDVLTLCLDTLDVIIVLHLSLQVGIKC